MNRDARRWKAEKTELGRRTVIRIAELTAANNPKKANREAARKHLVRLVGHDEAERRISDAHLPRLVTT